MLSFRNAPFALLLFTGVLITSSLFAQDSPGIVHRMVIIGDAGRLLNGSSIVPEAAAGLIDPADSNATVIFLGDNIYDKGMPGEEESDYAESVHILQRQLDPFNGYRAAVYLIPGNHDWEKGGPRGWERVKRQSAWVD
ncbi:MAG TPA: metallophosphoesterase, partial [Anseongella sp.]|nr:metallophosphoesterase [Anseongella sp.]